MNETASTENKAFFDSKKSNRLSDQIFPTIGPTDFENFTDKDLYAYCKKVGFNARIWSRKFMATIPEVAKRRLYKKYGYCSIHEFASKMAGVSYNNTDEVLRVNEKFKELPKMKSLIGQVGLSKLKVVACIATKDTDSFWAKKIKNMTKSSLEIYVKEMKMKEKNNEQGNVNMFIENYINYIDMQNLDSQGRIVKKFPGESNAENLKFLQQQGQINMFDSEKSMSQNANGSTCPDITHKTKKTFTIQIDQETEFDLRKFKQLLEKERKEPVDWNFTLKEMLKSAVSEKPVKDTTLNTRTVNKQFQQNSKSASACKTCTKPISRYIPAKIKHALEQKYNSHCTYSGCNKPAEQIHHQNAFSITKNHNNLIPLCRAHHDFVHQSATKPCLKEVANIFNVYKSEKYAALG